MEQKIKLDLRLQDNMEMMSEFVDGYFDLAIVDAPYGINFGDYQRVKGRYQKSDWDKGTPGPEYFKELKRISKNQIVWGGNYKIGRAHV